MDSYFWLRQVFQHIATDNGIEPTGWEIDRHRLKVAHEHLVQPLAGGGGRALIQLDPDDLARLAGFERGPQPARSATDVEDSAGRLGDQCHELRPAD